MRWTASLTPVDLLYHGVVHPPLEGCDEDLLGQAIGQGTTELSAFDAALVGAGVANFNLIRLSSVIPPNGEVVEVDRCPFSHGASWGDRLYAVYAEQRTSIPGQQVWAGVGWVQDGGPAAASSWSTKGSTNRSSPTS